MAAVGGRNLMRRTSRDPVARDDLPIRSRIRIRLTLVEGDPNVHNDGVMTKTNRRCAYLYTLLRPSCPPLRPRS